MSVTGTVLSPDGSTVFLTVNNLVLGTEVDQDVGTFRFLKDHFIGGEYVFAGEIRDMSLPWTPTPDVEPLDSRAVDSFYAMGPTLGGCIRTQFTTAFIYRPTTYWYQTAPGVWALSGLGAAKPPILAIVARIGDKEP